jgi:hypothetical protein
MSAATKSSNVRSQARRAGYQVSLPFLGGLFAYFLLTTAYSFVLKRK